MSTPRTLVLTSPEPEMPHDNDHRMTLNDAVVDYLNDAIDEGVRPCPHDGLCKPACDDLELSALQVLRQGAERVRSMSILPMPPLIMEEPSPQHELRITREYIRLYGLAEATLRVGVNQVHRVCKLDEAIIEETPPPSSQTLPLSSSPPTVMHQGQNIDYLDLTTPDDDTGNDKAWNDYLQEGRRIALLEKGLHLTDHDKALIADYQAEDIYDSEAEEMIREAEAQLPSSKEEGSAQCLHRELRECATMDCDPRMYAPHLLDRSVSSQSNKENVPPAGQSLLYPRLNQLADACATASMETPTAHCMENSNSVSKKHVSGSSSRYQSPTPSICKGFQHRIPFKSLITSTDPNSQDSASQASEWETENLDGLPVFSCSRLPRVVTTGLGNSLLQLSNNLGASTTYRESAMLMADIISTVSLTSNESLSLRVPTVSVLGPLKLIRAESALSTLIATYSQFREHRSTRGTMSANTERSYPPTSRDHVLKALTSLETTCGQEAWLSQTKKHFYKTLKSILRETSSSSIGKSVNTATRPTGRHSRNPTFPKSKSKASTSTGNGTPRYGNGSWRASQTQSLESSPCPVVSRTQRKRSYRTRNSLQLIPEEQDLSLSSSGANLA